MSVCLSVCPCVCLSVCLSVCPQGRSPCDHHLDLFKHVHLPPSPNPSHIPRYRDSPALVLPSITLGPLRTCSNLFNLDLTVQSPTLMDMFKRFCYVSRTVGKQAVGIPQKCVLTGSCVFQFIFMFAIIDYGPPEYGSYLYPQWAQLLGWLTSASILAWIPGIAIYEVCRQEGDIKQV